MINKEKLVFGFVVGSLMIPNVLAGNVIGTYKADAKPLELKSGEPNDVQKAEDTNGTASDKKVIAADAKSQNIESTDLVKDTLSQDSKSNGVVEGTPIINKGDGSATDAGDSQLKKDVKNILSNNPEIIVEALQKYTENQEKAQQAKLEASLTKYQGEISKESSATLLGKKDAEVKLVVFLDPNCPHCRPFTQALNKVRENFPKVAVLVRYWPILGKDSEEVIRGLWAIKQQGHDLYMAAINSIASSDERYTHEKLLAWVKDHKLNVSKFEQDCKSNSTQEIVDETSKLAKNIGIQGTPTSLLIDKKGIHLVMPNDEKSLKSILEEASKA